MNTMHDLRGVDLDLLICLDLLLQTRSVTRTGRALGLTQSATSHALRRLRVLLDDPVLVRTGNRMVPTPRAEALAEPLRALLLDLDRLLAAPQGFDPATARRAFRLTSPDLFDLLLLPTLVARVAAAAPGVDLAVLPPPGALTDALSTGALDLAILPIGPHPDPARPGELVRRTLFRDDLCCFLRRDHPAVVDGHLSLDAYTAGLHVMVSPTGAGPGPVDAALAALGRQRRIAVRVPSFAVARAVVARSDAMLTAPNSLRRLVDDDAVVALPPPLDLPGHGIAMTWHARFQADPAHRWLREQVAAVATNV